MENILVFFAPFCIFLEIISGFKFFFSKEHHKNHEKCLEYIFEFDTIFKPALLHDYIIIIKYHVLVSGGTGLELLNCLFLDPQMPIRNPNPKYENGF